MATFFPRTAAAIRLQIVFGRHAAGRIVGRVEEDRLGRLVLGQKPLDLGHVGPELVRLRQGPHDGPRTAPQDIRQVRREIRPEDEHAVARIEKRLAEELLEDLRAWPGDDVLGLGRDAELALHEAGRRLAELGDARRWTVVRLVLLIAWTPAALADGRAVERAVADFQLDDVLPRRFQGLGDGQHGKGRLDRQGTRKLAELSCHRSLSEWQVKPANSIWVGRRSRAPMAQSIV